MARTSRNNETFVALLRAINVSGKNKVPMKDLARMFEAAGCGDVRTYIQSGNVVFRTTEANAARVPSKLEKALADELGVRAPVILRRGSELVSIARGNPFLRDGSPDGLHVVFLAGEPSAAQVASLDARRSPGDELRVLGREIYLRLPNGVGKSKLTNAYFDSKLATTSTVRNWRTVLTLAEMSDAT